MAEAVRGGVTSLGITDHDTFAGYDMALPCAREAGLELICGIELSTKLHGHSVHLLGYFLDTKGLGEFRSWIRDLQAARRDRNIRLVARLQELGMDITLEEAEARGRGMTGRPHFAQLMVEKGYVPNLREAFDRAAADGFNGSDEASLVERLGYTVTVLLCSERNIKITKPSDLPLARLYIAQEREQNRRNGAFES